MKVAFIPKVSKTTNLPRENYFNRNMRRLKRAAVITSLALTLAFAGGSLAQTYDREKLLNPSWVKTEVEQYYARPEKERVDPQNLEERDRSMGFGIIFIGAKMEVKTNPDLIILKEALKDRVRNSMPQDAYGLAFMNVYIFFLENKGTLSPFELRAATDQKISEQFKGFLKEAPQKQPDAPVAVKLTMGQ